MWTLGSSGPGFTTPAVNLSNFRFAPLGEQHLPMLHEWLSRPHVSAWWGSASTVDELHQQYLQPADRPNTTSAFIAFVAGAPVGFIQCYVVMASGDGWWESETDPGARGIDQFVADEAQLGVGVGRALIRAFVEVVFADPAVTTVQADPDLHNERAIRCYRAVGFDVVGPVATPDGEALLMRCTRQSYRQV